MRRKSTNLYVCVNVTTENSLHLDSETRLSPAVYLQWLCDKFQATHIVITNSNSKVVVGSFFGNLYEKITLNLCERISTTQSVSRADSSANCLLENSIHLWQRELDYTDCLLMVMWAVENPQKKSELHNDVFPPVPYHLHFPWALWSILASFSSLF